MAVSTPSVAEGQLVDALTMVRMSRHHPGCRCGMYQRHWCSPDEKRWCYQVDRLLEACRKNRF